MDEVETINDLKRAVRLFCEERDWDQFHSPKELAIGISTESNELLQRFRFKTESQQIELVQTTNGRAEITEELADVFFFVLRFAQLYRIDLSECFERKMAINAKKYPVETSRGSNLRYDE